MAKNDKERDSITGVETTGHEWDGLKELNKPAPRWWLWVFLITIIWAIGYWIVYPAWPTIENHTKGSFGWTQYNQLKDSQAEITDRRSKYMEKFRKMPLDEVSKDPELFEFAVAGGSAAFKQHCATCHGTGAAGGKGFPNLNDDDWIWGGSLDQIYHTIKVGIRSSHPDTRSSMMTAFGKDGVLKRNEIEDVAEYVSKLHSGAKAEKTESYMRGKEIFANNCVACHGEGGIGSHEMGAPRLSDNIWLYGGDKSTIIETVTNSRNGVMPTWEGRIDDDIIKMLSIYVHSLGGGE